MSDSLRLRKILLKNKVALGLKFQDKTESSDSSSSSSENSDCENNILENTLTPEVQEELLNLIDNLNLDNQKMENIRFFTSLLPTFSGDQDHLESFIKAVDEFYNIYFTPLAPEDQKKVVLAAIKSKLVDSAQHFLLSRPDLSDWSSIKTELRKKFGDPITYSILMQQLQYFKLNKGENILQFVDRLKTFVQRIISKINCEVPNDAAKLLLINQVESTSVLILTANSPQTLKTMLMLQRPGTLNDAYTHVVNFNMIESQVNFTNQVSLQNTQRNLNNNNNNSYNSHKYFNKQNFNSQPPMPTFSQTNPFPRQPINVQPRPIPRHYPTNAQVFGRQSKPMYQQNNPPKQESPVPMSISTAGPSRIQPRQTSTRYPNFFQSTGPRNFISEELTNVQISEPYESSHLNQPPDIFYTDQLEDQPQNFDPDYDNLHYTQNFENSEENSENFQNQASNQKLT